MSILPLNTLLKRACGCYKFEGIKVLTGRDYRLICLQNKYIYSNKPIAGQNVLVGQYVSMAGVFFLLYPGCGISAQAIWVPTAMAQSSQQDVLQAGKKSIPASSNLVVWLLGGLMLHTSSVTSNEPSHCFADCIMKGISPTLTVDKFFQCSTERQWIRRENWSIATI